MGKGIYRFRAFRLSEMMPNSWFYKLRDMGSRGSRESRKVQTSMKKGQVPITNAEKSLESQKLISKPTQNPPSIGNRPSYYIPSRNRVEQHPSFPMQPRATLTHLPLDKPKRTKKNKRKKSVSPHNKLTPSSVSSSNTFQQQGFSTLSSEAIHEIPPHYLDGIVNDDLITSDYSLHIPLPPIVTKPVKKETDKPNLTVRNQSSKQRSFLSHGNIKRSTSQTPRIKTRLNSSKLAKKRLREKKGLLDSFVVVKLSSDPLSDFRESMLEMIFQNNLCASKDLEELLSCYLYLNPDKYHDLIVKAFKQIWFDLTVINLKYE